LVALTRASVFWFVCFCQIITSLEVGKFGAWEEKGFAPEATFLAAVAEVPGVTQVETQTFTLMSM
jgi:hypothetical protein